MISNQMIELFSIILFFICELNIYLNYMIFFFYHIIVSLFF